MRVAMFQCRRTPMGKREKSEMGSRVNFAPISSRSSEGWTGKTYLDPTPRSFHWSRSDRCARICARRSACSQGDEVEDFHAHREAHREIDVAAGM